MGEVLTAEAEIRTAEHAPAAGNDPAAEETTALVERPNPSALQDVTPTDTLFNTSNGRHLTIPAIDRAGVFLQFIATTAEQEIRREHEITEEADLDNGLLGALDARIVRHVAEWGEMLANAEMLATIRLSESNAAWTDEDGHVHTLEERFANALPDNTSSGTARQIVAFVKKTTRIWLDAGIPAQRIATVSRPKKTRMLADLSLYVNRLYENNAAWIDDEEVKLDDGRRRHEYDWMIRVASTCDRAIDFTDAAKRRYRNPQEPPPPSILYSVERSTGSERARVVADMSLHLYEHLFLSRLRGRLAEAPVSLLPALNPSLVETALGMGALWTEEQQRIMRHAIMSPYDRATCIDIIERVPGDWISVQDVASITDLHPKQIARALNELASHTRDGLSPFAERHAEEELWRVAEETEGES